MQNSKQFQNPSTVPIPLWLTEPIARVYTWVREATADSAPRTNDIVGFVPRDDLGQRSPTSLTDDGDARAVAARLERRDARGVRPGVHCRRATLVRSHLIEISSARKLDGK
jgi:hypothetical protein